MSFLSPYSLIWLRRLPISAWRQRRRPKIREGNAMCTFGDASWRGDSLARMKTFFPVFSRIDCPYCWWWPTDRHSLLLLFTFPTSCETERPCTAGCFMAVDYGRLVESLFRQNRRGRRSRSSCTSARAKLFVGNYYKYWEVFSVSGGGKL